MKFISSGTGNNAAGRALSTFHSGSEPLVLAEITRSAGGLKEASKAYGKIRRCQTNQTWIWTGKRLPGSKDVNRGDPS